MSDQVKVPSDVKRELALYSAISGTPQSALLAESWQAYKALHPDRFQEGVAWARSVLSDPRAAAVEASGMSPAELDEIRGALG
jgi:hypothetical protein